MTPTGAVFLSYASQDSEAARRICAALRGAGVEVWFDQSELRGGDAWDHRIRDQIRDCRLFIPVISASTERRDEGYFRREWRLAVERAGDMLHKRTFLVPVVVDGTIERGAAVPEKFQEFQWTRLPGGEATPAFVELIKRLLTPDAAPADAAAAAALTSVPLAARPSLPKAAIWGATAVAAAVGAYFVADRFWFSRHSLTPAAVAVRQTAGPADATVAFNPPPHSIAVLPFVNMSGDKEQEYFSDGLTEELLNSLARINELQVAARTSAFSFKGKDTDISTIAHKLNVAAVLEGSVRRSDHTIRITAQLIDAVTGFHLWSETYDRDLGDMLKMQSDIATTVAGALKVTLLGGISQRIELGGTRNPGAFDAYLRGRRIGRTAHTAEEGQGAIAAYTEAIHLDPQYALAYAERSIERSNYAVWHEHHAAAARDLTASALTDARTATHLAPQLAEGYYALGVALNGSLEFVQADEAYARALALAPGSARILVAYSRHAAEVGHSAAAIDAGRRAVTLDPLNFHVHRGVGIALLDAHQYAEALSAFQTALSLQPDYLRLHSLIGEAHYYMGAYDAARHSCELAAAADDQVAQRCLAMTYRKLGRNADAESMLQKLTTTQGAAGAYDYASIHAQWGDTAQALDWLETGVRARDPELGGLKIEPALDPLREEPRFQAIERALKFPD